MIKVLELFGGIGACTKALERLGIEHEVADYVEIDKYAVKSFNAVHGTNFEPQDICTWDKDIKVDLIMHGSPCQDFSVAGRQAGGDEGSGTRSSLMYETLRIVEKLKPKYVIWENVKNLLSPKHRHNFDAYQEAMRDLGYTNYYQVLNAKNYGVPQNRERVFTVSIRNDICDNTFKFPEKMVLEKKLKDILDDKVDEQYYLSFKALSCFMSNGTGKYPRRERFLQNINRKNQDIGNSVTTRAGGRPTDNFVKELLFVGGIGAKDWAGDGKKLSRNYPQGNRVYSSDGIAVSQTANGGGIGGKTGLYSVEEPFTVASRGRYNEDGDIEQHLEPRKDGMTNTITTVQKDNLVAKGCLDGMRIRKLTPKECWRLMGFDDADFEKAEKVNSNTQLYKQAGNSIVVNVLEGILSNLLKEER